MYNRVFEKFNTKNLIVKLVNLPNIKEHIKLSTTNAKNHFNLFTVIFGDLQSMLKYLTLDGS